MALANKSIDSHHVTSLICIVFILAVKEAMMTPVYKEAAHLGHNIIYNISQITKTETYYCKDNLFASFTAQAVNIPKEDDPTKLIYCHWKIRSPQPGLNIGISVVQKSLDFYAPNTFLIDIYDGPSASSRKLTYWHGVNDYSLTFFEPLVSTGDTIFINYTTIGGPLALHMNLIYYLCGGKIEGDAQIKSPIILANSTYDVPNFLECTWIIVKPDKALYGYLHVNNVSVPDCDTLSVTSSGKELIVLERINSNDTANESSSDNDIHDEFSIQREELRNKNYVSPEVTSSVSNETSSSEDKMTNSTENLNHYIICNNTVRGIAFFASRAILRFFIILPEQRFGFSATYIALRMPSETPEIEVPWYYKYTPVAIYTPIGIIIGLIIIILQNRTRKFPEVVVNRDDDEFRISYRSTRSAFALARLCCKFPRSNSEAQTTGLVAAADNASHREVIIGQPLTNTVTLDTFVEPRLTTGVTPDKSEITTSAKKTENELENKEMSNSKFKENLTENVYNNDSLIGKRKDGIPVKSDVKQSEAKLVSNTCMPLNCCFDNSKNVTLQTKLVN